MLELELELDLFCEKKNAINQYCMFKNVLVVEDDPFWQILIKNTFNSIDRRINVIVSENFTDAIDTLNKRSNIDLIIADYSLDKSFSGLDLWDMLQMEESQIPYILFTGKKWDEFIEQLMPYRTDIVPYFMTKPTAIGDLPNKLIEGLYTIMKLRGRKK